MRAMIGASPQWGARIPAKGPKGMQVSLAGPHLIASRTDVVDVVDSWYGAN
jgi:hypothetical protein